ncbi:helix-turn-helix domain-containing protein [Nocardioides sp. GCM10030258]|uniref:helix-turn-helix domain-containing protein n=1 Tax=unclassified Nocardioides TaxID=2615069 RepID=UPI0036238A81
MDSHLAALSRSIDAAELGRRIRSARLAAGLTQAHLADGEVTAAYISRIEVGQRRPGVWLLQRLAMRMGTTPHQLLTGMTTHEARQLELAVEHAAVALAFGESSDALSGATAAAERLEDFGDAALLAEAMRIKAEAHRALGDLSRAIEVLVQLTREPTPDMNTLRSLIVLCRCYGERDELSRAIAVGELADRMAARLGIDGLPEALQLAAARADAHSRRGDHVVAAELCRTALDAVANDGSQLTQAAAYWDASLSESLSNGATPAAIELAKTAHMLVDIVASRETAEHMLRLTNDSESVAMPPRQ